MNNSTVITKRQNIIQHGVHTHEYIDTYVYVYIYNYNLYTHKGVFDRQWKQEIGPLQNKFLIYQYCHPTERASCQVGKESIGLSRVHFYLFVTCHSDICVKLVFKRIHAAFTQCVPFINNLLSSVRTSTYFLISNLHRSFANCYLVSSLVLLTFLSENKIFLSIFSHPFNILIQFDLLLTT